MIFSGLDQVIFPGSVFGFVLFFSFYSSRWKGDNISLLYCISKTHKVNEGSHNITSHFIYRTDSNRFKEED